MDKTNESHESEASSTPRATRRADVPPPPIKTVKGQRHVAPAGRHSQQTHRRAQERAAAAGNATEKEQHAHDRSAVEAKLTRRADERKQQQLRQGARSTSPAKSSDIVAPADKPE